jgi:AcrR family transcriptional regulator
MKESERRRGRARAAPEEDSETIRQRIIDASIKFMTVHGSQKLSIVDVAHLAGVARATVYNYFGSKEGLIEAAEYSMDQIFFHGLERAVAEYRDLSSRAASMACFVRRCWTDHEHTPWYGFLSPLDEAVLVVSHSADHLRRLGEFIKPYVLAAQKAGEIRSGLDADRTSEWIARLVLSFALEPADPRMNDPEEIKLFFRDYLMLGLSGIPADPRRRSQPRRRKPVH